MPSIARIGDSCTTGHGCDAVSTVIKGSSDVFVNGIGVERQGDELAAHTILVGTNCVPHSSTISGGSSTVRVNGKSVARIGDKADAGSITGGSSNVFAN